MIFDRPVKPRASRIADMVASVPEETSRTCCTGATLATISSANATSPSPGVPNDSPLDTAADTASSTAGCA